MADDPSSAVATERRFARARGLRGRNLVQRVTGRDVARSGGDVERARRRVARTGRSLMNPTAGGFRVGRRSSPGAARKAGTRNPLSSGIGRNRTGGRGSIGGGL